MSTSVNIDLIFRSPDFSGLWGLLETCRIIENWVSHAVAWRHMKVTRVRPDSLDETIVEEDTVSTSEMASVASSIAHEAPVRFSVGTSFSAWTGPDADRRDNLLLTIRTNDGQVDRPSVPEESLTNPVRLTISPITPFHAATFHQNAECRVEENLSNLTRLVMRLAAQMRPERLVVSTDLTLDVPFNSHLCYFSGPEEVINDLRFIRYIWKHGLTSVFPPLRPLGLLGPNNCAAYFSSCRQPNERVVLWNRFNELIDKCGLVTTSTVLQVLNSRRFDFFNHGVALDDGFVVLEWPYFMDIFLDRFYTEVLEAAAE